MTPSEAANHYLYLAATDFGAAVRFAHEYEDRARPADFDECLRHIDLHYGE